MRVGTALEAAGAAATTGACVFAGSVGLAAVAGAAVVAGAAAVAVACVGVVIGPAFFVAVSLGAAGTGGFATAEARGLAAAVVGGGV